VVPVPEAGFVFERFSGDPGALGVPGLPMHVTVLYPFLAPAAIDGAVARELAALARACPVFEYELARVGRFPNVLYLSPSPPERFVALTEAVQARWPTHPPYGGAFVRIVPHVTLALGEEPPGLAQAVSEVLPVRARARELVLLEKETGTWRTRSRFPLGG
jgi:2'-5' RNA ligase